MRVVLVLTALLFSFAAAGYQFKRHCYEEDTFYNAPGIFEALGGVSTIDTETDNRNKCAEMCYNHSTCRKVTFRVKLGASAGERKDGETCRMHMTGSLKRENVTTNSDGTRSFRRNEYIDKTNKLAGRENRDYTLREERELIMTAEMECFDSAKYDYGCDLDETLPENKRTFCKNHPWRPAN